MARPKKTEEERRKVKAEIVRAAKAIFYSEGIDAVSIRAIAKRVNVGASTIYSYFDSSYAILSEIWFDVVYALEKALMQAYQSETSPEKQLEAILRQYVSFANERSEEFQITFMTPNIPRDKVVMMAEEPLTMQGYKVTYDAIANGIDIGLFRTVDINVAAQSCWSAVHGVLSSRREIMGFAWEEESRLVDQVIECLIRGLKA